MPAGGRRTWTLTGALRHQLAVVVLLTGIGVAAAAGAVAIRPPTYEATALIYLDARTNANQGFDLALQASELVSAHLVQASTTQPVLIDACQSYSASAHRGCSPASLATMVSASTVRTTSMLGVSVRTRDRTAAAPLANAVAGALVNRNRAEVDAGLKPTATYLDDQLKELSTQITAQQAALSQLANDLTPGGRAQAANIQAQLTLLQSEYSSAYQKKQDLLLNQSQLEAAVSLYQPASAPAAPVDPNPVLYLAAGSVAGLLLGITVATLRERMDGRVRDLGDLAEATSAPVALSIPPHALKPGSREQVRYYALARTHLLAGRTGPHSVVVAAASSYDRAYPVAIGLGAVAARAGQRVLVIDAEGGTRPPRSNGHRDLDVSGAPGRRDRRGKAMRTPAHRLDFLAVDADPTDDRLEIEDEGYDLTVIAAPPPFEDAAGICLARPGAIAAIVATAKSTQYSDARRAAAALRRAGIDIGAGILVNAVPRHGLGHELDGELLLPAPPPLPATLPSWRGPGAE